MGKKRKSGVSSKRGQRVAPSMQVQNCHSCQLLVDEDSQGYADRERIEDRIDDHSEDDIRDAIHDSELGKMLQDERKINEDKKGE